MKSSVILINQGSSLKENEENMYYLEDGEVSAICKQFTRILFWNIVLEYYSEILF